MTHSSLQALSAALDGFQIEIPSWGFADTGTRFGKFFQPAAAKTIEEKFADAAQVHKLTGCCPTLALHVLWDFPSDLSTGTVERLAAEHGIRPGSINPTLFQDQVYKHGSLCNEDAAVRAHAQRHMLDSVRIGAELRSRDLSLWLADGSNYPGTASIRARKQWLTESLQQAHAKMQPGQRLLVEYKPFEPAFYHTDIADWGMALLLARAAGPQAKVLVDTGHHYQGQNIEQIVAWLLSENMLGGFHFNDRRYADDDLTLGSIDPYQIFRIFAEIHFYRWETGEAPDVAYMIDQSHNLKPKIEAMLQTVMTAQELYAKAALIDFAALTAAQKQHRLIDAESIYRDAFATDVRPAIEEWRTARGLAAHPLRAYRDSGYQERITAERSGRTVMTSSYA
jgi:L-rhamnose isomerase/sugar isomerase